MRVKSFSARMAALEALEAAAEAKRASVPDVPDLGAMDDQAVLWEATLGVRDWCLRVELSAPLGPVRLVAQPMNHPEHTAYWQAVIERAQPLFDACEKPLVLLAPWEAQDAIAAIDMGKVIVSWDEGRRGSEVIHTNHHLWPAWKDGGAYDADLLDTLGAVRRALELENRQRYYPQPRNFAEPEMTTLAEWRAWLEGCYATV